MAIWRELFSQNWTRNNGDTLVIWDKIANHLDMCLKMVDLLPNYDSTCWKWWFAGEWNGVPVSDKPIVPDFEGREIPLVKLLYKDDTFPRCFPCFFAQIWFMDIYGNAFNRSYGSTDPLPGLRVNAPSWKSLRPCVSWMRSSVVWALLGRGVSWRSVARSFCSTSSSPGPWRWNSSRMTTRGSWRRYLGLEILGLFLLARFWIESSIRVDLVKLVVQRFNMFDMRVWEWLNVNFTCNGPILYSCGFFLTVVALMSCASHSHTHTHSAEKSFCTIMMLIWVSLSPSLSLSIASLSLSPQSIFAF